MSINSRPHTHALVMCANIFVKKDGKYLLLQRSQLKKHAPGVIHPIGGKIDANENPYLAAQREILEEAGVGVARMRLEAVILEINPPGQTHRDVNWLIFHFSADYESGTLKTTEEGEFVWLAPEDIPHQKLFPSVHHTIHHILNPHDGTVFATFEYDDAGTIIKERIDLCAL